MPGQTTPNLIGSSMHQFSGMSPNPCQLSPGAEHPAPRVGGQQLGRRLVERNPLAGLRDREPTPGSTGVKNHSFFAANSWWTRATASRHATASSMVSWVSVVAGRPVHHRGRHLVGGDQRVERRRARLRGIGLVEAAMIDGSAAIADMDERRLGQAPGAACGSSGWRTRSGRRPDGCDGSPRMANRSRYIGLKRA